MEELYYALNPWWEGKTFVSGISREDYLEKIDLRRKQIEVIIGSSRIDFTTAFQAS